MTRVVDRTLADASDPDRVHLAVQSHNAIPLIEEVTTSWRRCLSEHGVDPGCREPPRILTQYEFKEVRAPVEELIAAARQENDRLHAVVGKVGYAVLLTSSDGVVVDYRGDLARADEFKYWGIHTGVIWSEQVEGTNGIGTCIAEQRPVTVHRTQHFRTRHTSLSCCGAPIFDPDGKFVAVLDITSIDPDVSDRSHALALAVTIDSARAIEESLFRRRFRRQWILAVTPRPATGEALMLAVDKDQRIVGADHNARSALGLDDRLLTGALALWAIFIHAPALFRSRDDHMAAQLTRIGDDQPWRALITPPETGAAHADQAMVHLRSRSGLSNRTFGDRADSSLRERLATGVHPRLGECVEAGLDAGHRPESPAAVAALSKRQFAHLRIEPATAGSSIAAIAAGLSPRERSILELIGQGQSNKEIARVLCIAPETVKSHVKNMFVKLGVVRRAQAVYRAQNLGLAAPIRRV